MTKLALNLYAKCYKQAVYIKALMVNHGMLALWITFNPSDLKSLLMLILAGVQIFNASGQSQSASHFYLATVTMNLVAVTQFFEATCSAIFENLLHNSLASSGFLGPISTYFGMVKTNNQGILHLHCLIWLQKFFHLAAFCKKKLSSELVYSHQIAEYLDGVIK